MLTEKIHDLYSEFIYKRTYSRWIPEQNRRESYNESIDRYGDFFITRIPESIRSSYAKALNHIEEKGVMPSMRAFWSAGPALEESHIAAYNCAYIAIEKPKNFAEMLYVLMHGTGVGFSVERQFVQALPKVPQQIEDTNEQIVVEDSKLGWAKAYEVFIERMFEGSAPQVDVSQVRPKGARLKTFGGRSSGPDPFVALIKFTKNLFQKAKGRQLNSLEVHDICCKIADCVVVGGVRRSACISFSNLSDQRMKHAKDGQFWIEAPQRALANNSIAYTEKPDSAMFLEEWINLLRSGSGERGIFNVASARRKADFFKRRAGDLRGNPCLESLMFSEEFCNLTEVVVGANDTVADIREKIESAVLLGCVQSTLTDFPYISDSWRENCEEERLLGVSLTGVCDNSLFKKVNEPTRRLLADLRKFAHERSEFYAKALGINTPKQVTLVKPSGTVSQLCNCSSGIHPRYSDYYIRRVRVSSKDPIAKLLKDKGVPCNPEVGQTWEDHSTLVFEFPIKSPRGSLQRTDFSALEQLEYWKMFNTFWCDGNPSVTIYVKEDEWVEVGAWVYENWDDVCGLSFLPFDGGLYPLAPYEEISKETYYNLCKLYQKVSIDFDLELSQYEIEDETQGAQELACTGGSCELR